jgi:hypothetical protein
MTYSQKTEKVQKFLGFFNLAAEARLSGGENSV